MKAKEKQTQETQETQQTQETQETQDSRKKNGRIPSRVPKRIRYGYTYLFVDANRELVFQNEQCDIDAGVKLSKEDCVVGHALTAQIPTAEFAEVGASITLLYFPPERGEQFGKVFRFGTPPDLRAGLNHFDQTGKWNLPVGSHKLTVPKRKIGSRRDQFTEAGLRNTAERKNRPARTGRRTMKVINLGHINPRLIEFNKTLKAKKSADLKTKKSVE